MNPRALGIDVPVENVAFSFPPGLELAALRAHPRFPEAVRVSTVNIMRLYNRNRTIARFFNDRAFWMMGHAALCMDADANARDPGSGLTPSRFKSFCARTGLCSEGRAGAMLAIMRLGGYLEPEAHPADRRITLLRPGEKLLEIMRSRLRSEMPPVAMVYPEVAPLIERLGHRDAERAIYREFARRFLGGYRVVDQAPEIMLFAERDKGMMILFELMLLTGPEVPLPPVEPLPLSIAALARRFHVSRTHVLRLVRDAEAAGLLVRTGDKGELIRFSEVMRAGMEKFYASSFQMLAACFLAARETDAAPDAR